MKLIFIRHGDPDYEHDTLTEKGIREARCWENVYGAGRWMNCMYPAWGGQGKRRNRWKQP